MTKRVMAGQKQLRYKGAFQRRDAPLTDFASSQPDWENFKRAKFGIRPLSGSELLIAQQQDSQVTHEITTRRQQGITPAMRIRLDTGRLFHPVGQWTADEYNQWIISLAYEDVSDYGETT